MLRIYMQKAETVMDRYSDDDRTLICRISNGDEEAMKMLVHRYWPLVFRTSLRIVCDRHEAEDISQEVFIRVWKSAGRFDRNGSITAWIYRITCNRATDILRRKKFFPSYKKKQDETSRADGETSPEERLIASEEWKIFTEASEMLSPKQRIVFTLKEIEGLDTPAVTQITGLDADSIKSNLYHARKKICRILEKYNTGQM